MAGGGGAEGADGVGEFGDGRGDSGHCDREVDVTMMKKMKIQ
jgi:hypothetical protein